MLATERNELIKCRECGHDFNLNKSDKCGKCHSHICPKCGRCLCARVSRIFNDPIFKKEF